MFLGIICITFRISDIEIELVNAFGQTVARRTASNIQDELFLLNIHQLLPGFYTLNVLANGQNTSRKVLIK